jgi:hypothetical protein
VSVQRTCSKYANEDNIICLFFFFFFVLTHIHRSQDRKKEKKQMFFFLFFFFKNRSVTQIQFLVRNGAVVDMHFALDYSKRKIREKDEKRKSMSSPSYIFVTM